MQTYYSTLFDIVKEMFQIVTPLIRLDECLMNIKLDCILATKSDRI